MNRLFPTAALAAAALAAEQASAQQCYDSLNRCFSFAPPAEEVEAVETGLNLRSDKLTITGDIRYRARLADSPSDKPYARGDQSTTRTRVRLEYTVNEFATALVEFNYSEVWAGAEGYSDAQPFQNGLDGIASRENFNGVAQAYMDLEDAFGLGEHVRIGRSEYFLGNGLVLGSCDFLQYPGAFTGIWIGRSFGDFDAEIFGFDNYGPLQSQLPGGGERYVGGTVRWNATAGGVLETLDGYYLAGTGEGDVTANSDDSWIGLEAAGWLFDEVKWEAQAVQRDVANADDRFGYRIVLQHTFESPVGGWLRSVALTRTGADGALHINPADFNAAGLLHQYGGPWRSDLDTNQLSVEFSPGWDVDCTATVLTLDRGGNATQQGDFEFNLLAGKMFRPGFHGGLGYAIDNDKRQVGYLQATLYF